LTYKDCARKRFAIEMVWVRI